MFGARQAVIKNTPLGNTAGEKMNKSEKTTEKMVEKQQGNLSILTIIKNLGASC